jgi:DNA polymerase-3 subunit delta'
MSLKEIFCQDKAIGILQRGFAADKMPHAYIFAGAEGVGKFKTACGWAKLLLCEKPVVQDNFADSCCCCASCTHLQNGSHPDFHHVYKELLQYTRDGKDKKTPVKFPIDVVREFLLEKVPIKPALSQRKVFVLTEAEKLNIESQNCLLKVLEEPPQYCTIILICTRMEKLLPTTKSRCRVIRFLPVDRNKIVEKLEQDGLDTKKAEYFARLACGSLGQACKWAQLELAGAGLYKNKKELINSLSTFEYTDALQLAQSLLKQSKSLADVWAELDKNTSKADINRRAAKTIIRIIISALHDAMKISLADSQIINFDQKELIKKLTRRLDPETCAKKINDAYETIRWIEAAVNEKLVFDHLLLNLAPSDIIKF